MHLHACSSLLAPFQSSVFVIFRGHMLLLTAKVGWLLSCPQQQRSHNRTSTSTSRVDETTLNNTIIKTNESHRSRGVSREIKDLILAQLTGCSLALKPLARVPPILNHLYHVFVV